MLQRKRSNGVALAVLVFASIIALGAAAFADGPGVKVKAKGSVDEVVANLKKMVADNGMMVMGELHQGKILAMTGLEVQSETVFVGNPTVGKELFTEEPGAGLVVPVRINVYADGEGTTWVSYIPPSQELEGFQNAKVSQVATMLDGKLHNLVQMLAK